MRTFYRLRGVALLMALAIGLAGASSASAAIVLTEDFEGTAGDPWSGWIVGGTGGVETVELSDAVVKEGLTSGLLSSPNVGDFYQARQQSGSAESELWVDVWSRMDGATGGIGATIGLMNSGYASAIDLNLFGNTAADPYTASIVDSAGSTVVASGLVIGQWYHWQFGATSPDVSGDGVYNVYLDGVQIATDVAYNRIGATNDLQGVNILGNQETWYLDDLTLHDTSPVSIPEPATFMLLGLGATAGLLQCRRTAR